MLYHVHICMYNLSLRMLHIRYILYLSCLYHLLLWMVSYARFCKHLFISLTIMEASYGICSIEIHIYLLLWKPHMWFVLYTSKKYHLLLWKLHMWFVKYPTLYVTYYYGSPICVLFYRHPCISLIITEAPYVIRYIHMHNYISLIIMKAPYVIYSIHMHNYISHIIMKAPYVIR